jgi:hypothetical protein
MIVHADFSERIMKYSPILTAILTLLVAGVTHAWEADACPFCDVTQQTLSEEINSSDATVIATLEQSASSATDVDESDPFEADDAGAYSGAKFKIVEVLRGDGLKPGDVIEAIHFGEEGPDKKFVINGTMRDQLDWGSPLLLSDKGVEYVKQLPHLPTSGPERLQFFMNYLENPDPLLAQDCYDEFARAPYDDLIAIKDSLDRAQLVDWIMDSQVGPTRRRLYLTMLGLCGTDEDVALLESLLKYDYDAMKPGVAAMLGVMGMGGSTIGAPLVDELVQADVRAKQQCLDALIAAYLKLKGSEGLQLVEERFINRPNTDYTQLYSVIMALRFHGEESAEIPRERLIETMRLLVDNKDVVDQVIPDLTRWEDWEVMDKLVEKFKAADEDSWVRQPVVSYLLIAADQPGEVGEKANAAIAEIEATDPELVKRSRSYLSFGLMPNTGRSSNAARESEPAEPKKTAIKTEEPAKVAAVAEALVRPQKTLAPPVLLAAPSRMTIIVVPLIAVVALMGLYSLMLRGGHTSPPRTPTA